MGLLNELLTACTGRKPENTRLRGPPNLETTPGHLFALRATLARILTSMLARCDNAELMHLDSCVWLFPLRNTRDLLRVLTRIARSRPLEL